MTLAEAEELARRDKRRIVLLTAGALILLVAYFVARTAGPAGEVPGENLPLAQVEEQPAEVFTRPFQAPEVLATIRDASADERLALSGEALDALLKYSVTLRPRNYDALGVRLLDLAAAQELSTAPGEHRVDPLRLRGRLARLTVVASPDTAVGERQLGALELDGGGWAHVAFLRPPGALVVGDHVRLDGMFVHLYRAEVEGEFREGPLVAGNQLIPSHAPITGVDHEELCVRLRENVQDDTLESQQGEPFEELWALMAFARDRADEVDWEQAPVLDNQRLTLLGQDGTFFRGQPFRIDVSRNQGSWTADPGENGLRLDRITRGWIGNITWKTPPVIQFVAPFDWPHLQQAEENRLVTGHVFFLKNVYYEKVDGSPGKAPLLVAADLGVLVPEVDRTAEYILMGVLVGTVLLIGLIFFLLRSDARSSRALQEELTRRRRERRARETGGEASAQSS